MGELTQTQRDVRSESISATCIVDLGGFDKGVEEIELRSLGRS